MKMIHGLIGVVREGEWSEPRGNIACIHHEVAKGCFIFVSLGEAGVMITNGKDKVAIPLQEIVSLAQSKEGGLMPTLEPAKPEVH